MSATSGELRTSHMLPGFNPGVAPLGLTYNSNSAVVSSMSLGAADGPVFLVHYPVPSGTLTGLTAVLTFNGSAGSTFSYDVNTLDFGELMQIALQPDVSGLSTGRYNYSIEVAATRSPPALSLTTYTGTINYLSYASSAFGAGWSLDGLERLHTVTGASAGVILDHGGGYSLWFASTTTAGVYTTPAGDFSTLTQQTSSPFRFSRTLTDGTVITYNSSGYQIRRETTTGLITTYTYDGSNQLTTIKVDEDFETLVTAFAYSSGKVTSITDPAGRITTLAYDGSGRLTSIQDPDSATYNYAYDAANRLTGLTNPRTHTTTFAYNFASRVTGVTLPNSSTESLTAMQLRGLESATTSLTPVLVADAQAAYVDPRNLSGVTWYTRHDWKGYGYPTNSEDPLGNTDLAYRDANGLAWLESNPLGFRTRSMFDAKGNPTKIVVPNDSFHQFGYNSFSQVTLHIDRGTHTTTYEYDGGGRLTKMIDPATKTTTYTNINAGFVSTVTDPLTNTTSYHYDSRSRLTRMVDALSKTTTYVYDTASNLTSLIDQNSKTTTYEYDPMGRMTKMTLPGAAGAIYSYAYDAAGNLTAETVPVVSGGTSLVTTYAYDALNRLTKITDPHPLTQHTTYAYDGLNNLTEYIPGISTLTTTYDYDNAGRRIGITDPEGNSITYAYDAAGQVTQISQDLDGRSVRSTANFYFTYDNMGQEISSSDNVSLNVQTTRDKEGQVIACACGIAAIRRDGPITTYSYDTRGRITGVTQLLNSTETTVSLSYDDIGNLTKVIEPLTTSTTNVLTTTYTYDAVYQLVRVQKGDASVTYGYDAARNLTQIADGLTNSVTYAYDARNRVTASTVPTAAGNSVTTFAYDLASRLTSLTDSLTNATVYEYDAASRVIKRTDALGNFSTYAYDAANRLTSMTDRNERQRNFGYDKAGRLITETWPGTRTFTYAYDMGGRLISADDPDASYDFGYDLASNLTQALVADGTNTLATFPAFTLNYEYGDRYNRTALTDGAGGSITYAYDIRNRMTQASMSVSGVTGPSVTFGYDFANRMTKIVRNAINTSQTVFAVTSSYGYDGSDRLTNISHSWTGGSDVFTYAYDAASRITQYTSSRAAEGTITYAYDASAQLTNVTSTSYSETFTYDTNGNRTMSGYTTDQGNRLTADGTYTYAYDDEGNLTSKTGASLQHSFYWDHRNRLTKVVAVESGQTTNVTFTYDAFDRRIGKLVELVGTTAAPTQQWTVYDGVNPYADFNGTTSSTTLSYRYLYGDRIDSLLARYDATTTGITSDTAVAWYLTDNLDSVRRMVQTTGNTDYEVNYKAFGDVRSGATGTGDRFRFTGREWNSETSQYFYRARYYDPRGGRFTGEDAIGFEGGDMNLYRYVSNSPADRVDPRGLKDDFSGPGEWFLKDVISDPSMLGNLPAKEKEKLSAGCVGLMRARLGIDEGMLPWRDPKVVMKCFATMKEALEYRDKLDYPQKGHAKILVVQFGFWQDKPGPKTGEIDPNVFRPNLDDQNWCTLHEPAGKVPFWEWGDKGIRGGPGGKVFHKPERPKLDVVVGGVVIKPFEELCCVVIDATATAPPPTKYPPKRSNKP